MEIKIPESIDLTVGARPWSFLLCVQHVLDNHPTCAGRTGGRIADRIVKALLDQPVGASIELRKEDYDVLYSAFDAPAAGYCPELVHIGPDGKQTPVPTPARLFVPYLDALPPP